MIKYSHLFKNKMTTKTINKMIRRINLTIKKINKKSHNIMIMK